MENRIIPRIKKIENKLDEFDNLVKTVDSIRFSFVPGTCFDPFGFFQTDVPRAIKKLMHLNPTQYTAVMNVIDSRQTGFYSKKQLDRIYYNNKLNYLFASELH